MDRLISLQAAIDVVTKHYRAFDNDLLELIVYEMKRLPSAQPDVPDTNVGTNGDTIYRQDAIDAILAVTGNSSVRELYEHVQEHGLSEMWSGGVSAAIDVIIAVPSAQPKSEERTAESTQNVPNDELISRKAAIDAVDKLSDESIGYLEAAIDALVDLPSAQPERKTGKWIERNPQNSDKCRLIECDQCGFSHIVGFNVPYEHWIENRNFCERCGADMRGKGGK